MEGVQHSWTSVMEVLIGLAINTYRCLKVSGIWVHSVESERN